MLIKTLAVGAALSILAVGGSALAQTKADTALVTGPKEPIPYSQLDAYLQASPKMRASKDWWVAEAGAAPQSATAASVDTAATMPAPSGAMPGDAKTSADTSVNPMPDAAAPTSPPETPPPATPK